MGPPSSWSDCSVPLKVCTVSKGKVLLLYPNCCSLGRWVASLACVWSCFSAGSAVPNSVHSPSSTLELKSLPFPIPSHPIPSLLSTETVCIQLIADAMNPKVCRGNFVSGSSFLPASWWGSCQAGEELPAPLVSPFAVWEALTLVSSGWYHFQLQGEMLNIKPVLIGSETASKKETSDCARLNFTLHHSPPFISLPPHSMHK